MGLTLFSTLFNPGAYAAIRRGDFLIINIGINTGIPFKGLQGQGQSGK